MTGAFRGAVFLTPAALSIPTSVKPALTHYQPCSDISPGNLFPMKNMLSPHEGTPLFLKEYGVPENGTSNWIRTSDPLLRRQLLYPTELWTHGAEGD